MRQFMPLALIFWALGAVFFVWVAGPEAPLVSLASASASAAVAAASVSAESGEADRLRPEISTQDYHPSRTIPLAGAMRLARFGAIPWAAPGGEMPGGSILLAYTEQSGGPQVIEWDLVHEKVARRVSLGLSRLIVDVQMARAGEAGVVLVSSAPGGPVVATLLSPALAVRPSIPLGRGSGAVVVASDQEAYVAWLEESGKAVSIVRLGLVDGRGRARVSLPLATKVAVSEDTHDPIGRLFLVRGELWVHSFAVRGLAVFSPDLVKLRERGDLAGNLFSRAGSVWSIRREGGRALLTEIGQDLGDRRQEEHWWGSQGAPTASYDGRFGLAFSDGTFVDAFGNRAQLTGFSDAQSVFWAHGSLVALASTRKRGVGYAEWSGGQ